MVMQLLIPSFDASMSIDKVSSALFKIFLDLFNASELSSIGLSLSRLSFRELSLMLLDLPLQFQTRLHRLVKGSLRLLISLNDSGSFLDFVLGCNRGLASALAGC